MRIPTTHAIRNAATAMLGLALVAAPLAACSPGQDGEEAASALQDDGYDGTREITGNTDTSGWKTLADAYAGSSSTISSAYDDEHIVCVLDSDGKVIRVVAMLTPEVVEGLAGVDYGKGQEETDRQIMEVTGPLAIGDAQDLSAEMLDQSQMNELTGKTGKELVDEGFSFDRYDLYGGEETGATFSKGPFRYLMMFGCAMQEGDIDDDGESVMGETVTNVTYVGLTDDVTNPAKVAQE